MASGRGVCDARPRGPCRPARGGRTRFTWRERLRFPWWLGGELGGVIGGEVLRLVWKGNLRRLQRKVEAGA